MRIHIKGNGIRFLLLLPTGLLLSRPIAAAIAKSSRGKGFALEGKQLHVLFKAIKHYRKNHRDWVLLELESNSGEKVYIKV